MKKLFKGFLLASLVLTLSACGAAGGSTQALNEKGLDYGYNGIDRATGSYNEEAAALDYEESFDIAQSETSQYGGGSDSITFTAKSYDQKLITTYRYNIQTSEFDSAVEKITSSVSALGGYIEESYLDKSRTNHRSFSIVARIPVINEKQFLEATEAAGTVYDAQVTSTDVTLEYVDSASRVESLRIEYEALQEMLASAETTEDMLNIQDRLERIRYEIQYHESTLRTLDNKVNYTTFHITVSEVTIVEPVETASFWDRVSSGIAMSFEDIKNSFVDFMYGLIVYMPYIIIRLVVLAVVVFAGAKIGKKIKKKINNKNNKNDAMRLNNEQNTYKSDNNGSGNKDVPKKQDTKAEDA